MAKNIILGGPARTAPTDLGELPRKTNKVTFKEIEIQEVQREPPRPEGNFATKSLKKNNSKIDLEELDAGLEKLNKKVSQKNFSAPNDPTRDDGATTSSSHAWEVDPTSLTIGKILGNGSYGTVYSGTYKGEIVAVKMLEWGNFDDPDEGRRISLHYKFFREVEIMSKLDDHPNVCKFLGASLGSTNFHVPSPLGSAMVPLSKMMCCIVMEFMSGGTLKQFWVNHRRSGKRRMPFHVMVQFALDIANGLAYLHSHRICHRDLKPDNILMDDTCVLKIADFGVSRMLPEVPGENMSMYVGTPNYCAPEILAGKSYNFKCDVYSFGICIWEIYMCNLPYPEMRHIDHGKVNNAIIEDDLRPRIPCCCPKEFQHIMVRCWDSDPSRRPEMKQVIEWLEAINTDKRRWLTNERVVERCTCMTADVFC